MKPWLVNLQRFSHLTGDPESAEKVAKTKDFIHSLIDFTLKESSVRITSPLFDVAYLNLLDCYNYFVYCLGNHWKSDQSFGNGHCLLH